MMSMKPPKFSGGKGLSLPHPGNTPIVNHNNFTDATPTLGAPSSTYSPSGGDGGPQPKGPPKFVGIGGHRANVAQGVTNRRYQFT